MMTVFDVNNPAHITVMQTEISVDPVGMDYASVIRSTGQMLDRFNDPEKNPVDKPTPRELTLDLLLDHLVISDLPGPADDEELVFIQEILGKQLGDDLQPWREKIVSVFEVGSATEIAINGDTRQCSRFEVLWEVGTKLTQQEYLVVRDTP